MEWGNHQGRCPSCDSEERDTVGYEHTSDGLNAEFICLSCEKRYVEFYEYTHSESYSKTGRNDEDQV